MRYPVWAISDDGSLEYAPITKKYLKQTLDLVGSIYFKHEPISKLIGLDKKPEAITELLETLILDIIDQGFSYIAIDREADIVVGCQINILAVKSENESSFYQAFKLKDPMAKTYIKVSSELDEAIDVFEMLHTECYMEPMVTAILPEYRRKGAMKALTDMTGKGLQMMANGKSVQVNLDGIMVKLSPNHPKPSHILIYATSAVTTKVSLGLGCYKVGIIEANTLKSFRKATSEELTVEVLSLKYCKELDQEIKKLPF